MVLHHFSTFQAQKKTRVTSVYHIKSEVKPVTLRTGFPALSPSPDRGTSKTGTEKFHCDDVSTKVSRLFAFPRATIN